MKYKTIKIWRPAWCEIGTVVRVKNQKTEYTIVGYRNNRSIIVEHNGGSICSDLSIDDAEPVPAWEPTPGEYVAAWDDSWEERFVVDRYKISHKGKYILMHSIGDYDHIARITGVDYACSVEELKARTDWL